MVKTDIFGRPTAAQKALWEMEAQQLRLEFQRFFTKEYIEMLGWTSPWEGLISREPPEELGR